MTDATLIALLLARLIYKQPYPSVWWSDLKADRPGLPSYTQAFNRAKGLLDALERVYTPARTCAEVIIDSMPLPICRPKRTRRCRFPGARWGYASQGKFFGYKLHAWVLEDGEVAQYLIKPANLHDTTVSYDLNQRWPDFGGPKIISDKGYCCLGYIYPPKTNSRSPTRWQPDRHPKLRKRIETVFSQLVAEGIRSVQTKTLTSLRLRVALTVLAHNLTKP